LREHYAAKMQASPDAKIFAIVTAPIDRGSCDESRELASLTVDRRSHDGKNLGVGTGLHLRR